MKYRIALATVGLMLSTSVFAATETPAAHPARRPTTVATWRPNGGVERSPVVHPIRPARDLETLKKTPLYQFNENDVDAYLKYLSAAEPDPIQRLVHLARKNIGQPYDIYLLGEGPYELYDPDPTYCLEKSDCVTFVEHMYAMALSKDWPTFYKSLQRLRYKNGKIGMLTRNHESGADWDPNNAWIFDEINGKLGGPGQTTLFHMVWRPAKFFARWNIGQDLKDVTIDGQYIPRANVTHILAELKPGDILQIVRGTQKEQYIGHFGLVTKADDGTVNILQSTEPAVRESSLAEFFEHAGHTTLGLKVLRPKPNMVELMQAQIAN